MLSMHEVESAFYQAKTKAWAYDPTARDLRVAPVLYDPTQYASSYSSSSSPTSSANNTPATQTFHCPEQDCVRKFSRRYTLVEHQKTHSGEKPHVCPAPGCRKSFTTSGNLSRHKRLHGFIKPLECPVDGCRSTFASNNKLEKHMKYHLGSPVHVCRVGTCGKTFSTMGNLNRHVKHHHEAQANGGDYDGDALDSGRSSFSRSSFSSSYRGSMSSELRFQSPTATDDTLCSSHSPSAKAESSSSGHSIPFPRIYPSGVHANGNPERVWSSDTLLDSLSTIFDENEHQHQQQQYEHHKEHEPQQQYQYRPQPQYQPPQYSQSAMPPPSFPQSPSLLDDMIHFHVTNFQC